MTAPSDLLAPDAAYSDGGGSDTPATQPTPAGIPNAQSPQFQSLGPLLDETDPKKIVETIVGWVREQSASRKRRRAEWRCNELWLEGVRGVRLRRSEDRDNLELFIPLGAYDVPPVMDRVGELCEKTVAHLLSDPPVPDAQPSSDSDVDRDGAEFTTRLLTIEGGESGWNNLRLMSDAGLTSTVYASAFIYGCVDPTGGGWRPTEIQALKEAQTEQDATVDPMTGQSVGAGHPGLMRRYVTPDGKLTDDRTQARPQWVPKIVPEILTGENVVLLPESCSGISDAKGCIIIRYTPLAKIRSEFKDLANVDDEMARKLVGWSFEDAKYAKPGFLTATDIKSPNTSDGKVSDSAMVCTLSCYFTSHVAYPKGAYLVVGGDDIVLHKQTWSGMVETIDANGASALDEECLMLPLAQARFLDDVKGKDPYGKALVPKIGPADDVRGQIVLGALEHLDNSLHPIPFLPLGSIVPPGALSARDGTPVYFNPQGKPEYEQVATFPPDALDFFDRATEAQDSAVGLEETAQGTDSPNSQSGIAKQIVVQQSHVNLSRPRANFADCQTRWWRIAAQLYRVFWTIPNRLKYKDDDGAYKEREWSRVDLGSTRDVSIARGSYSQQSPEQKQSKLDERYQLKLIDPEEHERLSNQNIGATFGFQDNPHRMRVRRQLSAFKDGPAPDFAMKSQQYAGIYQQWQAQSQQAAAMGQPAPPPPPDPSSPFDVIPVDAEPDVAKIRWAEMRRYMSSAGYLKQSPEWRQKFDYAYDVTRRAAGITTVAEQQQAQQAQVQQQQQQAQAASRDKLNAQQSKQAHDANENAAQRDFASQQDDANHRMGLERDALNAAGDNLARTQAPPQRAIPT